MPRGMSEDRILSLDPGSERTGFVVHDRTDRETPVRASGKLPNEELLHLIEIDHWEVDEVLIEWTRPRGMPASAELFEAVWWAGRFAQAADRAVKPVTRYQRDDVKLLLTGKRAATDTNIRAALIDRYGGIGGKRRAIGLKASPGPLYGLAGDAWAALAVVEAYREDPDRAI